MTNCFFFFLKKEVYLIILLSSKNSLVFLTVTKFLKLFIYFYFVFWLHQVVVALQGLSLVVASGVYSSDSAWTPHCSGFSCCGARLLPIGLSSCSIWAQYLWCRGWASPWHVGSFQTRDWNCVPCIGRWIPIHCTTREGLC